MKIPPFYSITPTILELIAKIDANRLFLQSLNVAIEIKQKIQRISYLKSSLFSAKIEGNPLEMENIQLNDNTRERLEVINILKAIDYVDKNYHQGIDITKKTILSLHRLTMINISGSAGSFRSHQSAIFDKAGNPIYMPPSPLRISALIDSLLS